MITDRAKLIFSAYRRDDYANPDSFVIQLGMVLEVYSDEVIRYVSDPRTGVQRQHKFPPSIAEVVEACEAEATAIETRKRYEAIPKPEFKRLPAPPTASGALANVFVHPDDPRYAALVERSATDDRRFWKRDEARPGIWVALNWIDDLATVKGRARRMSLTDDDLRRLYPTAKEAAASAVTRETPAEERA